MQTADFYSSATGTLRVNGGRDENAPQGVSLSIDDLSYIKQGSRATDSGGTGTTDYNELANKPKINNVTLESNKTAAQLGLATTSDISNIKQVPTVTSSDNNKVLAASYSGGIASYAWTPASGGGTSDYTELSNKPQINSITLTGNVSLSDIGAQPTIDSSHKVSADNIDDTSTTNKFATAAQLAQITTNQNNILTLETMNGAKNYAQLTYTGSTVNNVTYTVSNGIITADGNTTTASTNIVITGEIPLAAGEYVLIDGLTSSSAQLNLTLRINNVWKGTTATGGKYEFTVVQGDTVHIELIVANNTSTAGVVFKPMIISKTAYDAGFTDFQPYAMTNAEITAWILLHS